MDTDASTKPNLEPSWLAALASEFEQPYMHDLKAFLVEERANHPVFPPGKDMFNAFWYTPLHSVRVVILGQDPYHGPGQAHGLCFSVKRGVPTPPSLVNIFKELNTSLGIPRPAHGELTSWARQGVLLLNTVLSVRAHQANSHQGRGWETFTNRVIQTINEQRQGVVFVLWGAPAGKKASMIDQSAEGTRLPSGESRRSREACHLVLKAPHPSPLSAHNGFFGCGHFVKINEHLQARGETPIDWALPA